MELPVFFSYSQARVHADLGWWRSRTLDARRPQSEGETARSTREFTPAHRMVQQGRKFDCLSSMAASIGLRRSEVLFAVFVQADAQHEVTQLHRINRAREERAAGGGEELPGFRISQIVDKEYDAVGLFPSERHDTAVELLGAHRERQLDDHDVVGFPL